MSSDIALKFDHVSWYHGNQDTQALTDCSFEIKAGEFVGIIGANDAGKSTICRICNGLIPNNFEGEMEGDVYVFGENIKGIPTSLLAQTVGSVFADPDAQMSQIDVFHELAFGPANLKIEREEIFERVEKVMKMLNLESFRDRSPFTMSGGEQQRVAIASVLTMEPEILVLDEPTSNLDPVSTEKIFEIVSKLNQENHMTVLLVEHEIELIAKYASRIIVMDNGSVVLNGTPEEVFAHKDVFDRLGLPIPAVKLVSDEVKKAGGFKGKKTALTLEDFYNNMERK